MTSHTEPARYELARDRAQAQRRRAIKLVTYILLTIGALLFSFPLFWTASSSLQTWQELRSYTPRLLPREPQWQNYVQVFTMHPFARWMLNSFLVMAIAVPGGLVSGLVCAYGFARFKFKGNNVWFMVMLGTMMIPFHVTLIPQYLLFHMLGWTNTYIPLTLPSLLGGGAFTIFVLRQFIMGIPRDLDEAAFIDGAGPFRILWQILVPLMQPAITTLAILSFLGHWNNFLGPFIYLKRYELYTVAVGLRFFQTVVGAGGATEFPREHLLMAGSAVMTVPVLIVFVSAQRYFVQGIVMTGLTSV